MVVHKAPLFEDDSYMVIFNTDTDSLKPIDESDEQFEYYQIKRKMFRKQDILKRRLIDYRHLPSLTGYNGVADLKGSVYTYTCEPKNRMTYAHMLMLVKQHHKSSRRCAINFADTLSDYLNNSKNTSCLNSIHYFKDNVTLYFRASDIKNELLIDLHLISEFFIEPVGKFKTITVFASTSQNIEYFKTDNLLF